MADDNNYGGATGAFVFGLLVGGAVATLFAPMAGKDLRRKIQASTNDALESARTSGQQLLDQASGAVNNAAVSGKEMINDVAKKAQSTVKSAASTSKELLDKGAETAEAASTAYRRATAGL